MRPAVGSAKGIQVRGDVPAPKPNPEEILVKVRAASLNRADLVSAKGTGPYGGEGVVVGLDWSGQVVEVGAQAKDIRVGDRVACSGFGGFAEYAVADWGRALKIPDGMDFDQAATLPMALLTMHNAIASAGRMQSGDSVLIHGASTAMGLMGLQIARAKRAKLVIGSSRDAARRARLRDFGADLAIDPGDAEWPEQVLSATGGAGANVVVDMVSGPLVTPTMRATAVLGRIVNVGRLGGPKGEFSFDLHAARRIDYVGVTFRNRSLEEVRTIRELAHKDVWKDIVAGRISMPIARTFPLDQAPEALAYMSANKHFGKILLTL